MQYTLGTAAHVLAVDAVDYPISVAHHLTALAIDVIFLQETGTGADAGTVNATSFASFLTLMLVLSSSTEQ